MPPVGAALLLTFSRGPLGVVVVGLLAYLVLGRPRLMPTGLRGGRPPTAVAMLAAYNADFSAEFVKGRGYQALSAAGLAEAHDLALTVGLCALGAATLRALGMMPLDPALDSAAVAQADHAQDQHRPVAGAVTVVVGGAPSGSTAAGWNVSTTGRSTTRCCRRATTATGSSTPGSTARTAGMWRWRRSRTRRWWARARAPTGSFWERERPTASDTDDAHSLYLETLGELGIVGFVLLAVGLLLILGAMVVPPARARPHRVRGAVLDGPGLGDPRGNRLGLGAARGHAVAVRGRWPGAGAGGPRTARRHLGWGCGSRSPWPWGCWPSRRSAWPSPTPASRPRWRSSGPAAATRSISAARSSISAQGNRPEPFQLEAYCQVRQGQPDLAAQTIRAEPSSATPTTGATTTRWRWPRAWREPTPAPRRGRPSG